MQQFKQAKKDGKTDYFSMAELAWISDDYFESLSPLSNVWIDQSLILSTDVTTRKPGSDVD